MVKETDVLRAVQPLRRPRGDMAEMVERIAQEERRDFNETEIAMIREGRRADAKVHWHQRKDATRGR